MLRGAMLRARLLAQLEGRLRQADAAVAVRLWDGTVLAPNRAPRVTVVVRSPLALAALATPSLGRLATAYVEGRIDVEGSARDALHAAAALCGAADAVRRGARRLPSLRWNRRLFDRKAIRHHYDVGDDFYALWLDRWRVYSCAYFQRPDDTLDIAQEQKLEHICRKLRLAPGERFLDIGCGWGALVMWAASRYGVNALGVTLSRNQHDYAREKIRELGLESRCEVRLLDYRDVPGEGSYDKIASVGMFEHVGRKNLPAYFGKIFRLLRPGGLVMNHGITLNLPGRRELGSDIGRFVDRYVFPGGELVHVSQVVAEMAQQGLECWDVENLRPHYARTLWNWVERLEQHRQAALAAVSEKCYRIWRIYMAGSAYGFERGWMSIYQILAGKPLRGGSLELPATRDYIYAG
jgi:cyclopropane-fatty-acyl-phospholipid synthase